MSGHGSREADAPRVKEAEPQGCYEMDMEIKKMVESSAAKSKDQAVQQLAVAPW